VGVTHRVVFGTQLAIEQVLAACGWTINTAFVERLNLDLRQRVAAIGRRVNTCPEGGCQGIFNPFQDTFARLCRSGALRRLSAWR
jgi:hypothetical protein